MKKEVAEEMGIQLSAKEISTFEFQNYSIGNDKLMRIYKILIPSEELQRIVEKAKAYQAALSQKYLRGMAYQEVYTSYIIPLDQFITESIERDVMFMADNINTYNAHSYFTNNTNGLMQFMQSRGKESKEEEKENKGISNNILTIPVAKTKFPHKVANYQFKKRKRGFEKRGSTHAAKVKENRVGVISR